MVSSSEGDPVIILDQPCNPGRAGMIRTRYFEQAGPLLIAALMITAAT